ncbi:MAG: hypothetical protein N2440_03260 [Actinobacteria bacterium]|nr:hypothetical protein [Actinomycetota bacterium]
MVNLESFLKKVEIEIEKNFKSHPAVSTESAYAYLPYAFVLGALSKKKSDNRLLHIGTALSLLAVSFDRHFPLEKRVKKIDLLKGDYFYARALQYTTMTGSVVLIKLLSQAVIDEIKIREKIEPSYFYSLILAAAKIHIFNKEGKEADFSFEEVSNTSLKAVELAVQSGYFERERIFKELEKVLVGGLI